MMPASTMKLVTTWTALAMLGPDFRWRTSAYTDGIIDAAGVLHGNLYIKGTGDPKLVPEELIDLVQKIRAAGIARIDGALVLDKTEFDASTRDLPPFDDDANAPYNVGPDPLLYAFKAMTFTLAPSRGGVSVDMIPPISTLQIDNHIRLRAGACRGLFPTPQFDQSANGEVVASFTGTYATRCGERSINMAAPVDHSQFFAGGFLALWQQAGGSFGGTIREGKVPANARLVAVHQSPPLADVVHDINKFSNNVMARNLFLTIGATASSPPSTTAKSAAAVATFLRRNGISMPELQLDNGCGLSRDEHVSALSLANLLQAANASPVAQVFVDSLPIAGVDGTMRHRLGNEPVVGNAHIKTGTLRDVRAIAGYVAAANGQTYIVVSLINDPRAPAARAAHDALLEWVYQGMPEEAPVYVEPHPKRVSKHLRAPAREPRHRRAHSAH
jgi:D-alanyl-D-alanine carboxypeptidase/D-alanyl-D-alanine-endopeptidase (penicillin-binding protein 4)